jgi:hypothetical protein
MARIIKDLGGSMHACCSGKADVAKILRPCSAVFCQMYLRIRAAHHGKRYEDDDYPLRRWTVGSAPSSPLAAV